MPKKTENNSINSSPYNRNINSESDMIFLYRSSNTSFSQIEFLKLINTIQQHGGKVKKDGNVFLHFNIFDKILNEFKNKSQ